jgi:hypothetical protein
VTPSALARAARLGHFPADSPVVHLSARPFHLGCFLRRLSRLIRRKCQRPSIFTTSRNVWIDCLSGSQVTLSENFPHSIEWGKLFWAAAEPSILARLFSDEKAQS